MMLAPILLFVYNRPAHAKRAIEALLHNTLAAESELFIYSDAARSPEDCKSVNEVRSSIHLSEHKIQKNDIVTILPETFVHVHRQSPDCRLYLVGFNKELLNGINFFNSTKNYLSALHFL